MKTFVTKNSHETKKLGEMLAKSLSTGQVICLLGDLGAGKTTFTQGFLDGLGVSGPYTSPTFVIMKQYHITCNIKYVTRENRLVRNVYHIDAYRVGSEDILNLGWEEITKDKNNVIIVEWAERIRDIIPEEALWIDFSWIDENERKIIFKAKG